MVIVDDQELIVEAVADATSGVHHDAIELDLDRSDIVFASLGTVLTALVGRQHGGAEADCGATRCREMCFRRPAIVCQRQQESICRENGVHGRTDQDPVVGVADQVEVLACDRTAKIFLSAHSRVLCDDRVGHRDATAAGGDPTARVG